MKNENQKKYLYIAVTAISVVAVSILFFFLLFRLGAIFSWFGKILNYLMPIVYGIVLAYLLLPLYNLICKKWGPCLSRRIKKQSRAKRITKLIATTICILLAIIVIGGLIVLVVPQVYNSLKSVFTGLPQNLKDLSNWINNVFADNEKIRESLTSAIAGITDNVNEYINSENFLSNIPMFLSFLTDSIKNILSVLENIIVGIIVAVYVLNSTKLFAAQAKKLTYSLFKVRFANTIIHNFRYTHRMLSGFINGRLLESLIVGVVCFIFMTITGMPYPLLISVVIGITNIIPFFGPFIGAIPSAVLILTVSGQQTFWFVVFIIILQQIDGNILGPRISSSITGVSSFWVMFALLLFGGLFGVWGMLLGVPIFAVIKSLFSELIKKRLKKKSLPVATSAYSIDGYLVETEKDGVVTIEVSDDTSSDNPPLSEKAEKEAERFKHFKSLLNKVDERFKNK